MKKSILLFIALMTLATVAITSCQLSSKQEKEAYQESIEYSLTLPTELFEIADVEVTYAGDHGILTTDTVTREQTVPIWEAGDCRYIESDDDMHPSADTTKVVWQKSVMADSIPAHVFITARLLSKPVKAENMAKRYNMLAYMGYLYDTGVEVAKGQDPDPNDSIIPHVTMGKQSCFLQCIDVSGSKAEEFIKVTNDGAYPLDFTIRREKPGSQRLHDFESTTGSPL